MLYLRAFDGVEEHLSLSVEPVFVLYVKPVEPLEKRLAVGLQTMQLVQLLLQATPVKCLHRQPSVTRRSCVNSSAEQ